MQYSMRTRIYNILESIQEGLIIFAVILIVLGALGVLFISIGQDNFGLSIPNIVLMAVVGIGFAFLMIGLFIHFVLSAAKRIRRKNAWKR